MRRSAIPVYIFTGFLDSGKTSFIRNAMDEGQFKDGLTTLHVICEEGEETLDVLRLTASNFIVKKIEDEDEVTTELLEGFNDEVEPSRVIIETNGLWDIDELIDAFPESWHIAEIVTTVDCTTFEMYLNNMKMMMTNQFQYSDLVLFNRCKEEHDRAMFKRIVRAVNRRTQILYEDMKGQVGDDVPEELPYDMDADVIEIADEDFGIFYVDTFDNLAKYVGKTVSFKAMTLRPKNIWNRKALILGRNAMTCCADDIAFVGFPAECENAKEFKDKEWVMVKAELKSVMNQGEPAPFLIVKDISQAEPAEEDVVYFY